MIKTVLVAIAAMTATASASAESSCKALSAFVGEYRLVSKTCDSGPFGDTLMVREYNHGLDAGYWLETRGIEVGISSRWRGSDKCVVGEDGSVRVLTCFHSRQCSPRGWAYTFTDAGVSFLVDCCEAVYTAQ